LSSEIAFTVSHHALPSKCSAAGAPQEKVKVKVKVKVISNNADDLGDIRGSLVFL